MDKVLRESDVLKWMADLNRVIENLRSQIADREAERAKAQMVLEVMGSRGANEDVAAESEKVVPNLPSTVNGGHSNSSPIADVESRRKASDRPMGIPTSRQMILTVVREANRHGEGLTLSEIFDAIRQRWWADAPSNRLRPMVWSMWKEKGILKREGERYFAEPPEASKNEASYEREFEEA